MKAYLIAMLADSESYLNRAFANVSKIWIDSAHFFILFGDHISYSLKTQKVKQIYGIVITFRAYKLAVSTSEHVHANLIQMLQNLQIFT